MERLIPPQPNPTTLYTGPLKLGATMTIEVTYMFLPARVVVVK